MRASSNPIESIVVVGGGDAGLLTALALEKGLASTDIMVIDDFEESVPEVGKSTLTELVRVLHDSLDINSERLINNVKSAWKTTVYFKDWCGVEPFHSPLGASIPMVNHYEPGDLAEPEVTRTNTLSQGHEAEFQEFYYRYKQGEFSTMYGKLAEHPGQTPVTFSPRRPTSVQMGLQEVAYHFNSHSLNDFLRTLCEERGVDLVNDRITLVKTHDDHIERIASESTTYSADLYVDASGFKRLLMSELSNDFIEFDLPVDSAAVTTTDLSISDIVSATVVTSGDAGWFWQIDTIDVRDLGYVYSTSHLSDEAAKRELIATRDEELDPDDIRLYRFESGVMETAWRNNCVVAGNSLGFVEPLQSTALTTSALLAERLARLLGKHGRINHEGVRRLYNSSSLATWHEIYKFISIYYKFNQGETPFWEDARSIDAGEIPQLEAYQDSGFAAPGDWLSLTQTDAGLNGWYLYLLILHELGVESQFLERLEIEVDPAVQHTVDAYTASLSERAEEFLSYEEFYHTFHPGFD